MSLGRPDHPGLRIPYADSGFLLATKLVAQRARDADDVVALATSLGMEGAAAAEFEAHTRRYDTDEEALKLIVGGEEVDKEVRFLAEGAAGLLARRS